MAQPPDGAIPTPRPLVQPVDGRVAGPVGSPGHAPGDETALKDGLRVVAIVPARGGTDPVPYLNIKRLGDVPLLAHTHGQPATPTTVTSWLVE